MKKYTYSFANGETSEIEVTEEWAEVLTQMDEEEKSNDRSETRRHVSLERFVHEEDLVLTSSDDIEEEVIRKSSEKELLASMRACLCPTRYDLIYSLYFLGYNQREYAVLHGMTEFAVAMKKKRAIEDLKNFFKKFSKKC